LVIAKIYMSLIQSLLKPAAYPHPVTALELIETHISWIILTGEYAYKIKKNIQFDFLDFSTLKKRHFFCDEELRLNRRLAPQLYLQVVPITGTLEQPKINGSGEILEYAVQMRQFCAKQLLSEIVTQGNLDSAMIDQLADLIADFHAHIKADTSNSVYGTVPTVQHWFLGNFAHIRPLLTDEKILGRLSQLEQWGKQELLKNTLLMAQRKQQGFIRECHGDLHLGNIALFENRVTPFDGIEFNPELRWIDVISEVAFVVMDLIQHGMTNFAYRFLNRYLTQTGDYQGLSLLRYYLVYRALVRTKIALLRWLQHQNSQDLREAENYLHLAENFSHPQPPVLMITHGYSGSGKSIFSEQLAETLGWIHLRSDVERQRLLGTAQHGANRAVNQGIYSAANIQLIYQTLADLVAPLLNAGFSVIVDAAFLQREQRVLFEKLAIQKQVKFLILDFQASEPELSRRITQRLQSGNDASEATLAVLQQQLKTAQALTKAEQEKTIQIDSRKYESLEIITKLFS
jgi:hypothetical protein